MAPLVLVGTTIATYLLSRFFRNSNPVLLVPTWTVLFIITFITHKAWYIFVYPRYSPFRHLPAPDQGPILKRLFQEPFAKEHAVWINEVPNDGIIRYHGVFNGERLLITDPDGIKDILTLQPYHYIMDPFTVKVTRRTAGQGLIVADLEEHKFQRHLFQPVFKLKNIREFFPIFWKQTSVLVKVLDRDTPEAADGKRVVEIGKWANAAALDTFALAAMNGSYEALEKPNSQIVKSLESMLTPELYLGYYKWALILPYRIWRWLPMKQRHALDEVVKDSRKTLKSFMRPEKRLQNPTKERAPTAKEGDGSEVGIMARMLESGHPFTEEQLMDHIITFLIAGHDTTGHALAYTIYQLSRNPEMQKKLRAEIRSKLPPPESDSPVDSSLIESLTYLTATIQEGVRLASPVPHIRRQVHKRGTTILGHSIPVGTRVSTGPWALNRSKKLWGEDALEFRPERWIRADTGKIDWLGGSKSPYSNNSFGHGARTCIGERFAKGELSTFIAGLVGRFEWEWTGAGEDGQDAEPTWITGVTTKASGGLWFKIKKLDGW